MFSLFIAVITLIIVVIFSVQNAGSVAVSFSPGILKHPLQW